MEIFVTNRIHTYELLDTYVVIASNFNLKRRKI